MLKLLFWLGVYLIVGLLIDELTRERERAKPSLVIVVLWPVIVAVGIALTFTDHLEDNKED